jgi:hypothetical protein
MKRLFALTLVILFASGCASTSDKNATASNNTNVKLYQVKSISNSVCSARLTVHWTAANGNKVISCTPYSAGPVAIITSNEYKQGKTKDSSKGVFVQSFFNGLANGLTSYGKKCSTTVTYGNQSATANGTGRYCN